MSISRSLVVVSAVLLVLACVASAAARPAEGRRVLFQSLAPGGGDTLYTMHTDGSHVRRLPLRVPGSAISPDWSPGGRRMVFAVPDADGVQSLWVADSAGRHAREVVHCDPAADCLSLDYPAWSPDGRSIAFTHYDADPPPTAGPPSADSIRVVDLASGSEHVAAASTFPRLIDLARWSPDGTRLVVEIDRFAADGTETGCRIAILRLADGRLRPLISFSHFAFHPDWSPRGNLIAFDTYDLLAFERTDHASNVYTIRPDGTHLRQLTHLPPGGDRASAVTFTPSGQRISFTYQTAAGRSAAFVESGGGPIMPVVAQGFDGPVTHPRVSRTP